METTIGCIHYAQNDPGRLRSTGCAGLIDYHSNAPVEKEEMPGGFVFRSISGRIPWRKVWSILEESLSDNLSSLCQAHCELEEKEGQTELLVFLNTK
jgi:hypothetical protein